MIEIIAIVPARGGSKAIPRKNVVKLCGKPLLYYTIKEARKSAYLNKIVVSTEDKEIKSIAESYGIEVIPRPKKLARDKTPSLPVFQHAIKYLEKNENYKPEIVVILQPTSPLRKAIDIDAAIKKLLETGCDSVITVRRLERPPHWTVTLDKDNRVHKFLDENNKVYRRQEAPRIYIPNGAVFITWRDIIMKKNAVMGSDTRAIIMPPERSVDIDTKLDLLLAEKIMREKKIDGKVKENY